VNLYGERQAFTFGERASKLKGLMKAFPLLSVEAASNDEKSGI
jgi:hypothetical protein